MLSRNNLKTAPHLVPCFFFGGFWKKLNFFSSGDQTSPLSNPYSFTMSAIDQTISAASSDVKPKKERAPRLPAKFGKFIEFGFYFVQFYNQSILAANDGRTPLDQDALHLALQVFGSVDDQQSFVQGFFDNSKDVKKQMRDVVKKFNKANAPSTRKPRAKKSEEPPSESNDDKPKDDKPKAKRGRKPAALVANGNPDIVAEIVAIAQANPNPNADADSKPAKLTPEQKKAAAQAKKDAKTNKPPANDDTPAPPKKDTKTKTKTSKPPADETKPKKETKKKTPAAPATITPNPVTVHDVNSDDDDDEEPLQVSILSLNGKQFLIDDDKTVYDIESQEPIGKFDSNSQSILSF